jgi:hypothetical protein
MKNIKVQIVIVLDEEDKVSVSTSSKNIVTNLGLMSIAREVLKQIHANQQPQEESKIVIPRFNA